jgi:hypothetical protein
LSLPSVGKKHSAKSSLPSVIFLTLGKEALCRVSKNYQCVCNYVFYVTETIYKIITVYQCMQLV